jgi:TRAP-type C4-dicarboxylate transport system substrate-binding protein
MRRLKNLTLFFLLLSLIVSAKVYSEEIDPILKKYNLTADKVETIYIKIGTLAPVGTPWIDFVYDKLIPYLAKESRGVLKIQLYAGGVMGEDTDILRKMKLGQLQGCGCTALGIFSAAPETSVLTLPLLFNNYEEVDFILNKFRPEIDGIFEKRGFYLMGLIDTGFFYLYMKNMAGTLDEIRKQKMLTWFGDIETTTLSELGINPIKVSVPEIVTSLQTGLINANIGPPTWQMGTQAYIYTKYYISKPLFYSIAAIILEKEQIDRIIKKYPPGLGKEVVDLARKLIVGLEKEWREKIRDYESRSLRAFENSGMKRLDLNENDMQTLQKASESVWYKLANKLYPEELMLKILKELRTYRSERGKK